jgi:uncharacterized membrane protein
MPITTVTLHPAVVHFPIALLLLGSAAGLLYLAGVRQADLVALTWWPLRLGWLGGAVALLTGLLAQSRLPPQAPYTDVLNWHIGASWAMLLVYAVILYRQWLYRNRRRAADPADLLDAPGARGWLAAALAAGSALVLVGGWLGGELVYTWGVNVP